MIELTFLIPDEDFAREVERGLQILEESPFKRRLAELVAHKMVQSGERSFRVIDTGYGYRGDKAPSIVPYMVAAAVYHKSSELIDEAGGRLDEATVDKILQTYQEDIEP